MMDNIKCIRWFVYLSFLVLFASLNLVEFTSSKPIEQTDLPKVQTGENYSVERVNVSNSKELANTERIDPLNKFKKYKGGFNITNKHYWSSTAYTGIYGYAIGIVWLLCGVLYGGFLLISKLCCCRRNGKRGKLRKGGGPCLRKCHLLLLGAFITILAIIASGVVLGGVSRFHSRAKTVIHIIVDTAEGASNTINNVTGAMRGIRDNLATSENGAKALIFLTSTSQRLDTKAAGIRRQAKKNRNTIDKGLKILYITTTVTISLNLAIVVALCVSGFLKFHKAFYMFIVVCWLLAALCWIYFGLYFFLERFAGDTCTALEDFQQDPRNNSLSLILPCNKVHSAKSVLLNTKVGIYKLINEVNANISALRTPSLPNIVQICNPFSAPPQYLYEPQSCRSNTIPIGNIPEILKIFKCSDEDGGRCNQGQFISNNDFKTVEAYTSSIQTLLDAFPNMESLLDCQPVKTAFADILTEHCKPVKSYVKLAWTSILVLAVIMMVLTLVWLAKACHERKSKSHHLPNGSVKPSTTTPYLHSIEDPGRHKYSASPYLIQVMWGYNPPVVCQPLSQLTLGAASL